MSQWNNNNSGFGNLDMSSVSSNIEIRPLMRLVYMWMGFGLLTTAIISGFVAANAAVVQGVANLFFPIIIAQFAIVFGIGWAMNRVSPMVAGGLFFTYAVLNGLTFGVIFAAYVAAGSGYAIMNAFLTTAGLFGAMTVVGYTTKVDLTQFSTFFMMAIIGLVIAMVVNIFLGSTMIDFIISVVGVLLFTGLTAYDTQRIKQMSMMPQYQQHSDAMSKLAIFGALQLYLDFINLFLFLLRLFAGGRD